MSELSPVELIKRESRGLRGTLVDSLADPVTGALRESDTHLLKFHGSYQQDDRDLREERRQQKLEPAYSFMIRTRLPGGICTPEQWLVLDGIAQRYGNGSLRITTRQAFQIHGVLKTELKATIAAMNATLIDSIAACGDVNRNVMASANPVESRAHAAAYEWATRLSEHLKPHTRAYHEIWLDGEKLAGTPEAEPVYGPTYLPRKFKAAIAVPPVNDVDIYSNDLGFIAIVADGELQGFNLTVGGGLGTSHGEAATYPRLADVVGFLTPGQLLTVAEAVVTTQRDFGDRGNRKHARLKYTIDERGTRVVRRRDHAPAGLCARAAAGLRVHGQRRSLRLDRGLRWPLAPDAAHRVRAGPRLRHRPPPDGAARDRPSAPRRLPSDAQPEPGRGQRRAGCANVHRCAGGALRA